MSNGIVESDSQAIQQGRSPIHKSKFPDLSYHLAGTYRFGEIAPHFVAEVENNDKWPLRSAHNVRSFNLKAPMLSEIYLRKNYFQIPMEAILPLNWDKVITPPVNGEDVDAQEVNCVLMDFPGKLKSFFEALLDSSEIVEFDPEDESTYNAALEFCLKFWVAAEYFLSSGSLFSSLNIHLSSLYEGNFDTDFDAVFSNFVSCILTLQAKGKNGYFGDSSGDYIMSPERFIPLTDRNKVDLGTISFGWFLDTIRDQFDWTLDNFDDAVIGQIIGEIVDLTTAFSFSRTVDGDYPNWPLNYKRLVGYQILCHHFFSNDKVDYIYSAELYRQLIYDSLKSANVDAGAPLNCDDTFDLNGLSYRYDYLSGHSIKALFDANIQDVIAFNAVGNVFRLLFGFNRSLRYLDYFSGSKTQPLAPGDYDSPVVAGKVSAIDITKSIQAQRFGNFVHLVGRKFEEYIAKLNGKHVDFDWHNPVMLAKGTSDKIYGSEVENNNINPEAPNQPAQSTTGTLRGSANTTAFEMEFDRPSVILGVTWFDIERYYADNIERQNFHITRFDMFNEFMQYIGDQPVYLPELNARAVFHEYFGYKLRHSEYKDRVNQCFGGFASGALSGWEFIADQSNDLKAQPSIGPDYIRSRPSEMDPFFLSLSGYSRGTYFHFIIDHYNHCEPIRPMIAQPQILA